MLSREQEVCSAFPIKIKVQDTLLIYCSHFTSLLTTHTSSWSCSGFSEEGERQKGKENKKGWRGRHEGKETLSRGGFETLFSTWFAQCILPEDPQLLQSIHAASSVAHMWTTAAHKPTKASRYLSKLYLYFLVTAVIPSRADGQISLGISASSSKCLLLWRRGMTPIKPENNKNWKRACWWMKMFRFWAC